ncbi:permease prefix domain 1-containing protein [Microbacter sp. GSS18]|nr:permease prefix domain 1-containing protein [Microbacter sp. GSS18]
MTETTLTERYIAAAMRTVPEAQRRDLATELRGSIDDQIDARVEAGEERADAERAVLTELGDPDKLAAGYTGRALHLIGPKYFLDWLRLVKLLLWIAVPAVAFALALAQAIGGASLGEIVGSAIGAAISVAVNVLFWVTLVFAIMERNGAKTLSDRWTPDDLPEPRQRGAGVGDVVGAFIGLLAAAAALMWDHFIGFVPGMDVSFFSESLWPVGVTYALLILAADAILLIVVHAARRWTPALAIVSALLTVALAGPAIWLLANGQLLNPEFFPTILPSGGDDVQGIMTVIIGFAIAGSAIWGIIDTFRKAFARPI